MCRHSSYQVLEFRKRGKIFLTIIWNIQGFLWTIILFLCVILSWIIYCYPPLFLSHSDTVESMTWCGKRECDVRRHRESHPVIVPMMSLFGLLSCKLLLSQWLPRGWKMDVRREGRTKIACVLWNIALG